MLNPSVHHPPSPSTQNQSPTKDLHLLRYRGGPTEDEDHMRDGVWGDLRNEKQVMKEAEGKLVVQKRKMEV